MHGSDRGRHFTAVAGLFCALAVLLAIATAFAIGDLGGRESERRNQAPKAYHQAAEADAKRSCIGADPLVLFECVYEKVETSAEQAHDEQDLSAQQRAATSALIAAIASIFGLGVSIVGIYYIRRTIRQGQEGLDHARKVSQTELRPYIYVSEIVMERKAPSTRHTICVKLRNYGRTPAIHMNASIDVWIDQYPVPEENLQWDMGSPILVDGICAPDQERRVFAVVIVDKGDAAMISKSNLGVVIQIFWSYESEFGEVYEESADHIAFGREWRKGPYYLLSAKHFATPKEGDEQSYEEFVVEAEGESQPHLL